jgi:hypothetical protein
LWLQAYSCDRRPMLSGVCTGLLVYRN